MRMGMPRKRSRKLSVDGKNYIYMVKETHIPEHHDQKELSITVQADVDRPGRVMQFRAGYGTEIGPTVVMQQIERALQSGWDPTERGAAFQLSNIS